MVPSARDHEQLVGLGDDPGDLTGGLNVSDFGGYEEGGFETRSNAISRQATSPLLKT